ncbi:MAG TPA: hypothetical protein VFF30_05280 [Nitrososphaerales archaeon]|nr:hypothetical protein [Nitrososphaerales archaeon]
MSKVSNFAEKTMGAEKPTIAIEGHKTFSMHSAAARTKTICVIRARRDSGLLNGMYTLH